MTMTPIIFVLGAPDPEMTAVEARVREAGATILYATVAGGHRVHPGNAYEATGVVDAQGDALPLRGLRVVLVECGTALGSALARELYEVPLRGGEVTCCDHHRPGDPGYGRPPTEFWAASSLGQVVNLLAVADVPHDLLLAAAADHCLGAAYRGECPGVDPDALGRWRAASRAAHQGRSVEAVLADVEAARVALARAPHLTLFEGVEVADMRPGRGATCGEHAVAHPMHADGYTVSVCGYGAPCWGDVPELPEAATRDGIAYVAQPRPGPDGRAKVVCSGPTATVGAFMAWASAQGLTGSYGDAARGFAGAYLPS